MANSNGEVGGDQQLPFEVEHVSESFLTFIEDSTTNQLISQYIYFQGAHTTVYGMISEGAVYSVLQDKVLLEMEEKLKIIEYHLTDHVNDDFFEAFKSNITPKNLGRYEYTIGKIPKDFSQMNQRFPCIVLDYMWKDNIVGNTIHIAHGFSEGNWLDYKGDVIVPV